MFMLGERCPQTLERGRAAEAIAGSERVAFVPGHAVFFADGSGRNTLRLSYSTSTPRQDRKWVIERLGGQLEIHPCA